MAMNTSNDGLAELLPPMIAHPHLETPPRAISPVEETVEKLHLFRRRPPITAPNLNMRAYLRHEPENDEQKRNHGGTHDPTLTGEFNQRLIFLGPERGSAIACLGPGRWSTILRGGWKSTLGNGSKHHLWLVVVDAPPRRCGRSRGGHHRSRRSIAQCPPLVLSGTAILQ
jgi:hypothetical protein